MKYVRAKDGKIEILADGDSIPAGAETIFSTDPSVYEGTWDKPHGQPSGEEDVPELWKKRADIVRRGDKLLVQEEQYPGEVPRDTSYVGTRKQREKTGYDPEQVLGKHKKLTGWKGVHKPHPSDKVCLNCGKPMPGARPNKKFCSQTCKNTYGQRIRRAEKKAIKQFVPHTGHEGQIYYMQDGKIKFVPALWCDTEKRAEKYVKERYDGKELDEVLKQVKGVMKK